MFASTVVGPVPIQFGVRPQPAGTLESPAGETPADATHEASEAADKPIQSHDAERTQKPGEAEAAVKPNGETLNDAELRLVEQMKVTDQEIRRHELAHQVAGGAYTGGASYTYDRGPDGNRYVVAGEVPIDYGPIQGDPQATISKMQQVISAALAPADPSPKDHQVAASARGYLMAAQLEMAQQQSEMHGTHNNSDNKDTATSSDTTDNTDATASTRSSDTASTQRTVDSALSQYDIIARTANSSAQEALQSLA